MGKGKIVFLLLSFVFVWGVVQSEPVSRYTGFWLSEDGNLPRQQDPLYQRIQELARKLDQQPVEPSLDPVWKLIPGYNGLRLDVEGTYRQARLNHGNLVPILEEIPTAKGLKDFPPSPIYRGNPQKKMVALMINVAWGNEYLPKILQTLEEKQVKATFFLDGSWASKHPELAGQIAAAGHEIGNHAMTHPQMSRLSRQNILAEIQGANEAIRKHTGITPVLFAPPSGDFDQRVVDLAHAQNMLTILWTLDTVDWRNPPAREMVRRIIDDADNGHLILMHPTRPTAEGLAAMIDGIRRKGLKLGTVSQVISPKREDVVELDVEF